MFCSTLIWWQLLTQSFSLCCWKPHLPIHVSHKHSFQPMHFASINCKYHKTLCAKTNVKQVQQLVKECWVETPPSFHWISQGHWLKQIWYHWCGPGTLGWINSHLPLLWVDYWITESILQTMACSTCTQTHQDRHPVTGGTGRWNNFLKKLLKRRKCSALIWWLHSCRPSFPSHPPKKKKEKKKG